MSTHKPFKKNINKVGIIAKRNIAHRKEFVQEIIQFLEKKNKKVFLDTNIAPLLTNSEGLKKTQLLRECDIVIVLGGDGTLLKTARRVDRRNSLVLGINMGNLGFLTEAQPEKLYHCLNKIFKGEYIVDRRTLLRVTIYRNKEKIKTFLALNDAVINQGSFARLIKLRFEVDQRKLVTFKADGAIIATPTGSTAHSLSAGGPIIHPTLEGMVITPICPTSMTVRPIIIPHNRQLTITLESQRRDGEIGLTLDGQETFELHYGDIIKIRKSARSFNMARIHGNGYYKMLREKLNWGGE